MNILEINHVSKSFGETKALDDVSLTVEEGEVYGLLGPNGAGKSTLIRIIAGITMPDSGEANRLDEAADSNRIAYLPEERGLYKKMHVGEHIMFMAQLRGMARDTAEVKARKWLQRFEFEQYWNKPITELSKGMAQKVQFICTVVHDPKLVILDEPFSGFDPVNADMMKQEVRRMAAEGTTFILSTHDMASVEELCDSITLINHGKIALQGKTTDIRKQFDTGKTITIPVIPSMNEIFIKVVGENA